jgi:hypothetical protein
MKTADEILRKLAESGGKVVSTASLSTSEIAEARAEGRMYVDEGHLGYVWISPAKVIPLHKDLNEQRA